MIYCYPKLSDNDYFYFRILGPGLGNLLFPWARALTYASVNEHKFINPTWPQLKLGPILRREPDSRMYSGFFNPLSTGESGFNRLRLLTTSTRVAEENAAKVVNNQIIEFRGMQNNFQTLLIHHKFIKEKLFEITRDVHKRELAFDFRNSISIHVRLGDFGSPNSIKSINGSTNTRISINWYVSILKRMRKENGNLPAYIFSDGTDDELSELLKQPNCKRIQFGSAIADLLNLSRAAHLIASGSTFSMWASYLGRMPVVWHPGQMKQKLYFDNESQELELEY